MVNKHVAVSILTMKAKQTKSFTITIPIKVEQFFKAYGEYKFKSTGGAMTDVLVDFYHEKLKEEKERNNNA